MVMSQANSVKRYFLAPTRDCPPDGPIRLGSIISIPALADEPLNSVSFPIDATKMKIYEHNATNYTFFKDKRSNGHIGIWASFLSWIFGVGGDAQLSASNDTSNDWTCETLTTKWFTPSTDYIKQSLEDADVKTYLEENKVWEKRAKVYMIAGVKIAYGASSTLKLAKDRGINLHFGNGGNDANSEDPAGAGAAIKVNRHEGQRETFSGTDPFVFAIRLREIVFAPSGGFKHELYNSGAILDLKSGNGDDRSKVEALVEGLADVDADAKEFSLNDWAAYDTIDSTNDVCACAMAE